MGNGGKRGYGITLANKVALDTGSSFTFQMDVALL